MRRTVAVLALLASAATSSARATQSPAPGPSRPPIEIDAVFVDTHGAPVRDINRDEVEVWIAGRRIPLETFVAVTPEDVERSRRSIVLLLDDITLEPAIAPRVREAGRHLVQRLRPGDQMAVIALSGDVTKSTDDKVALLQMVDRFNPRATGFLRPDDLGEQVLKTVSQVSQQVAESGGRRRTIIGIGSGWVFDTPLPPPMAGRELGPEWIEAMRSMASANVTLYVIDPGGVGRTRLPAGDAGFARESGGFAFLNTNDVKAVADQIMNEASNYYILGVSDPPMFRGAPLREVDVRVKRRGVTVRARRALSGPATPPR